MMFYKCHNCDHGAALATVLKELAPELYQGYILETFREKSNSSFRFDEPISIKKPETKRSFSLLKISDLPNDHFAKQYIRGRMIPEKFWSEIIYTDNMNLWVKENINKDQDSSTDAHVVVLIRNSDGDIVGCNGRSLKPENKFNKYTKAKVNEDVHLIFGIERVDTSRKVYVFEGEFNAMFVDNAVAVGGINNMFGIEKLLGVNKELVVLVVDKDRRNKEVVTMTSNLIDEGYAVVLFPGNIEGKDVNEFVTHAKLSTDQIQKLLEDNTYAGLSARLKMTEWRKC